MVGVEQWRASIGLYHSRSRRQLAHVPVERQLVSIPIYHLVGITMLVLILAELLVYGTLFVIWVLVNGYSLLKWGLTCIMASKKRTSGTQLLVCMWAIGQVVMETISGSLERSVRAMAILLIMAGDVEENPGPLPPTSASRALRHHFASLVTGVSDPLMLSLKLFSVGIIDIATKDTANLPTMTRTMKNDVLLSAVMSRVNTDTSLFHQFVDILKDDGDDILKSLGGKLQDTFNEFTKEDTEQSTRNSLPAKQPRLSPSHIRMQPSQLRPRPTPSYPHHPSQPPLYPQPSKTYKLPPPMTVCFPLPPAARSFLLFVRFLRSFYNSEVPLSYCKWPPVPKKKFINLASISREKVNSTELKEFMLATLHGDVDQILEAKAPIKIEDILLATPEETLHCVLVEGAPGVGKTTLSWEICKRWGRRELFQQYIAVLLLKLRDQTVQNAESFIDFICYMYVDEDEGSRTNILQHMKQTEGKDILIILEGLDELPKHLLDTDRPSIFTCLLSRKILPNATVLVTSRPSATVQLRKGWEISRHIEVLGFRENDITNYIQSTLSPQELPAFDNYLSINPNIKLTMYIPLNCAIVVEIYRSCQQSSQSLPTTTTELYTCLVQTILIRYMDSHPDYKDDTTDFDKFSDLPTPIYQHFYKLIQMAYDGVQSQQLTFHDQHKPIVHLGFMDSVTELFPTKRLVSYSYNFLHLSLQEYLAAYYVSLKSMDEQRQLLQTMCTKQHLRNMGRFLAGITKLKGIDKVTVKAIIEHECEKGGDGSLTLSPYTLQLLHESGDYSIIKGYSSYSCNLTDYSPMLHFAVLGHCIAKSSYKWTLTLGGSGQKMPSINRIATLIQALKSHSSPNYTIEIYCYYIKPESVQHLLLELPQYALQQIQRLELYSHRYNPHPLPQWVYEHSLSKMSRLHSLELWYGAVSTGGAIAIANIIKNNNTLRYVALRWNSISREAIEVLEKTTEIKKDLKVIIDMW